MIVRLRGVFNSIAFEWDLRFVVHFFGSFHKALKVIVQKGILNFEGSKMSPFDRRKLRKWLRTVNSRPIFYINKRRLNLNYGINIRLWLRTILIEGLLVLVQGKMTLCYVNLTDWIVYRQTWIGSSYLKIPTIILGQTEKVVYEWFQLWMNNWNWNFGLDKHIAILEWNVRLLK